MVWQVRPEIHHACDARRVVSLLITVAVDETASFQLPFRSLSLRPSCGVVRCYIHTFPNARRYSLSCSSLWYLYLFHIRVEEQPRLRKNGTSYPRRPCYTVHYTRTRYICVGTRSANYACAKRLSLSACAHFSLINFVTNGAPYYYMYLQKKA